MDELCAMCAAKLTVLDCMAQPLPERRTHLDSLPDKSEDGSKYSAQEDESFPCEVAALSVQSWFMGTSAWPERRQFVATIKTS